MSPADDADRPLDLDELVLATDLYQLTMLQTYFEHGLSGPAVFELFFREVPAHRSYLVCAGLGTVLSYLPRLRFGPGALGRLAATGLFHDRFLDSLGAWRFTGQVWAMPEGTPVFPHEPVLQVEAPLPEAQLVETLVLNQVHFQTVIASKAARVARAARGRPVVDFGLRRAHGLDAGMKAVRAGYIGGIESTSNVIGGLRYGVPVRGTMAHSAIEAFGDDLRAFRAFSESDPGTTCLVDTFDTLAGVEAVIALARELGERFRVQSVRLDSGDLAGLSRAARRRLDEAGLGRVRIFASGGLDEYQIERLVASGAPIDAFGVGTSLDASVDAPTADFAYKLVAYEGQGRIKLSSGKAFLPGRKQVFRAVRDGRATGDTLTRADEAGPGRPLLRQVMKGGVVLPGARATLPELQARCRAAIDALPEALLAIGPAAGAEARPGYPVAVSPRLQEDGAALRREIQRRLGAGGAA